MTDEKFDQMLEAITRVEGKVDALVAAKTVRDWYTTEEVANLLGRSEFTVREWCRHGRVNADKKGSGRGKHLAWVISHTELLRIQKEGLLALAKTSSASR